MKIEIFENENHTPTVGMFTIKVDGEAKAHRAYTRSDTNDRELALVYCHAWVNAYKNPTEPKLIHSEEV